MKTKIWVTAALAGIVGLAAPYQATASEYFTFDESGGYDNITLTTGSHATEYTIAGLFEGYLTPTTSIAGATPFGTYCIDLTHNIYPGQQYQVVQPLPTTIADFTYGNEIAYIYQAWGGNGAIPIPGVPTVVNGHTYAGLTATDYTAAVQVAIWTLVSNSEGLGDTFTFTSTDQAGSNPNGPTDGSGHTLVGDLLAEAAANAGTSNSNYAKDVNWVSAPTQTDGPGDQEFLIPPGQGGIVGSPEPATLTLASLSLACCIPFGVWRRRRSA
jgi:hypothetical protein